MLIPSLQWILWSYLNPLTLENALTLASASVGFLNALFDLHGLAWTRSAFRQEVELPRISSFRLVIAETCILSSFWMMFAFLGCLKAETSAWKQTGWNSGRQVLTLGQSTSPLEASNCDHRGPTFQSLHFLFHIIFRSMIGPQMKLNDYPEPPCIYSALLWSVVWPLQELLLGHLLICISSRGHTDSKVHRTGLSPHRIDFDFWPPAGAAMKPLVAPPATNPVPRPNHTPLTFAGFWHPRSSVWCGVLHFPGARSSFRSLELDPLEPGQWPPSPCNSPNSSPSWTT